jgi:hypothetical protein
MICKKKTGDLRRRTGGIRPIDCKPVTPDNLDKIQALSVSGFQPDGFISHAIFPERCPGLSCGRLSAWG